MSKLKLDPGFLPWLGIILITLALIVLQDHLKWLTNYPKDLVIPFDRWLNSGMGFLITYFESQCAVVFPIEIKNTKK